MTKTEDHKDYYLSLDINKNHESWWSLVWCSPDYGWLGLEEVHEVLFRMVPLFTSKEANDLKEKMEGTGFFYPALFSRKVLEISVRDYWWLDIFYLSDWDEDEGCGDVVAAVRADGHYQAVRYFKERYPDKVRHEDSQVRHISNYRYGNRWEKINRLASLEADLKAGRYYN